MALAIACLVALHIGAALIITSCAGMPFSCA
jgi:hypothetical protein